MCFRGGGQRSMVKDHTFTYKKFGPNKTIIITITIIIITITINLDPSLRIEPSVLLLLLWKNSQNIHKSSQPTLESSCIQTAEPIVKFHTILEMGSHDKYFWIQSPIFGSAPKRHFWNKMFVYEFYCQTCATIALMSQNLITTVWLWRWLSNQFELHFFLNRKTVDVGGGSGGDKTRQNVEQGSYCLLGLTSCWAYMVPNNWSQIFTNFVI